MFFFKKNSVQEDKMTLYVEVRKGHHEPPCYHGYKGGFDTIIICKDCNAHALRNDWHPVNTCPNCGGSSRISSAAKWDNKLKRWLVRDHDSIKRGMNPEDYV